MSKLNESNGGVVATDNYDDDDQPREVGIFQFYTL